MLLLIVCVILLILLCLTFKPLLYWPSVGVKQKNIFGLWLDNWKVVFQLVPPSELLSKLYNSFGSERYIGTCFYFNPVLFLRDPDLIKQLTVKDFEHFMDHFAFITDEIDPLWSKNLFALKGEDWKDMRATLSPSFTSSKMRGMFSLIKECAENFVDVFKKNYSGTMDVELKDAFSRYTNDVIASAAFGVTCNSMVDRNNEFYLMGRDAINFSGFWRNIAFIIMSAFPRLAKYLDLKMFSNSVRTFFKQLITNNMKFREENEIVRPDMIHLLMEAKRGRLKHDETAEVNIDTGFATVEESSIGKQEMRDKRELTDNDITSQALIFFLAGFESVSNAMCFAVHELAVNWEVQKRLQDEIDDTLSKCSGNVTYEGLLGMKYLDMVLSETLRKWPATTTVDRVCVKPYTLKPVHQDEKEVYIPKGTLLWIPTHAIHRSPKFYPKPDLFNPDRFSDENKSNIHPYSYVPFGSGPRSCIGNRFALLETKILIFTLLASFDVVVNGQTQIPLKMSRKQFNLMAEKGFYVDFHLRKLKSH